MFTQMHTVQIRWYFNSLPAWEW